MDDGRHLNNCVTANASDGRPGICVTLPSGARVVQSGAIFYAKPDTGVLRAAASSVWLDRGEPVRLNEEAEMDTSRVEWGHFQLLHATGLGFEM